MIPFEKAYDIVMNTARRVGSERVALNDGLNRILAEDVRSDSDLPPFRKSAMDGFACRREDLSAALAVVETIPAGSIPKMKVGLGQCAKIMTGAMVPDGADCVIMVEMTQATGASTIRFTGARTADNICPQGEDVRAGDTVLPRGTRIGPAHIAVLASVGAVDPLVARRPTVGIIATGAELVDSGATPAQSQIRNSNSHQLAAQAVQMGADPLYYGIAPDEEPAIQAVLQKAWAERDVVLLSGGVSAGDFDLVPDILRKNGIELVFDNIAIKPGKPTVFGVGDGRVCFGLPGNPVSTFIIFELLVKPFLYRMMGHEFSPPAIDLPVSEVIRKKDIDRESWMPIAICKGRAVPLEFHGSAHIHALSQADGLICIPRGVTAIEEGAMVRVRLI